MRRAPGQSAQAQATLLREGRPRDAGGGPGGMPGTASSWEKGAAGEKIVGNLLDEGLDPHRWMVLHDLQLTPEGANVDHLVIGPPGVFTINTKNHEGRHVWVAKHSIWVAGHPADYLRKARWEAREVQRRLKAHISGDLWVTPVLAVFAGKLTVRGLPDGVGVIYAAGVHEWIASHVRRFSNLETLLLQHAAGDWARSMAMSA